MYKSGRLKEKIRVLDELKQEIAQIKTLGKRIVFTNGCFDILHAGHVKLLQDAAGLGDMLVVAVNSDSSVKSLKGEKRPIIAQDHRASVVAGLESVDFVVIFDEPDPFSIIEQIKPDVLVKGGDWDRKDIVGWDIVEASGGSVLSLPFMDGLSTTGIISKILKLFSN